jgi:hypothetical protein
MFEYTVIIVDYLCLHQYNVYLALPPINEIIAVIYIYIIRESATQVKFILMEYMFAKLPIYVIVKVAIQIASEAITATTRKSLSPAKKPMIYEF